MQNAGLDEAQLESRLPGEISINSGINPEYSLEGLMLKQKFRYFGHLRQRTDSLEKTLMLGGIGGRRRRKQQRTRRLDGITDSIDFSEQTLD